MTAPLLLIAASGLAREVLSVCAATGRNVVGVVDDDPAKAGAACGSSAVLGPLEAVLNYPDAQLVICAGNGTARRSIATRLAALGVGDDRYATAIDPSVDIPASCHVGVGTILLAGVVLTADVTVGRHVVCMPQVVLTHDNEVADFATFATGVRLGGGVRIGEAAYLGLGAMVRQGLTVGASSTLGMGSVLLVDQPSGTVYAGVPARPLDRE